jgi:uncharacterized RmlC-like cupin family protein
VSTFKPNRPGIRALKIHPGVAGNLEARTNRGMGYAEATAPVDTGEYKASFRVTVTTTGGTARARLSNTCDHAIYVEFAHRVHNSTRIVAGQHILGRSIDAMRDI